MSYLRGLIFAAILTTARSSGCSAAECQDETSLVQIKANITRHASGMQEEDASGDIRLFFKSVEHLKEVVTRGYEDCKGTSFDNGEDKKPYPQCYKDKADCNDCVKSGWSKAKHKENIGAGHKCCKEMIALVAQKTPLCGICARYHAKKGDTQYSGLKGPKKDACVKEIGSSAAGVGCDQSSYTDCAKHYCDDSLQKSKPSPKLIAGMAENCVPTSLKETHTGMIAVVANNPNKPVLAEWLFKSGLVAFAKAKSSGITGTASSSEMATCVLKELKKADVSTNSGPWGGDADLAGILSKQSQGSTVYVRTVIFFADEEEAHRQDILALKNVIEFVLPKDHAYDGPAATALLARA